MANKKLSSSLTGEKTQSTTPNVKGVSSPASVQNTLPSTNNSASAPKNTTQLTQPAQPSAYQGKYNEQINQTLSKIMNREPFEYDMNADKLYNQYKDNYMTLGNQAMQDTIGNAALLTGGYGNSYGVTAGQQAYNSYLQQLNNIVPELEQRAYERWLNEGDTLYSQLSALQGVDDTMYNRYRDSMSDYYNERDYNRGVYESDRNFNYQQEQDALAQSNWQKQYDRSVLESDRDYNRNVLESDRNYNRSVYESDRNYDRSVYESDRDYNYQKSQDALAQSNWQKQYDRSVLESDRDYNRNVLESDRNYNRSVYESDRDYNYSVNSSLADAISKESENVDENAEFNPSDAYEFLSKYGDDINSDEELAFSLFQLYGGQNGFEPWLDSFKVSDRDDGLTYYDVLQAYIGNMSIEEYMEKEEEKASAKEALSHNNAIIRSQAQRSVEQETEKKKAAGMAAKWG